MACVIRFVDKARRELHLHHVPALADFVRVAIEPAVSTLQ
jgi:hypothetical protein